MSTFVKLNTARNDRYLGLELAKGVSTVAGESTLALVLRGGQVQAPKLTTKSKAGKDDAPIAVAGPQHTLLHYGIVYPRKYELMLSVHPDMYKLGFVQHPILLPPEREYSLTIQVQAFASLDGLKDLPWELSLYLVD